LPTIQTVAFALALLSVVTGARASELKIATWNLNWLTTRPAGARGLPSDVKARTEEDFDKLRQYAQVLSADVIAVEEVDGRAAAVKVFPVDKYSIHMTHDHVVQRTGLIVRRGLHYDINADFTALAGDAEAHLRSGADITLHLPSGSLRILAVHLKTGCHSRPLDNTTNRACAELAGQIGPLRDWIAARVEEKVPYLVLGDFNRHMDGHDAFLSALTRTVPLRRATEGHSDPCWSGGAFIDHILAGGAASDWMRPETLTVLRYKETEPEWKDRLSDHCPVSVRLAVPD
jgi:endonuclease/exonuclease/phosphatase family metal-dependent hydrolase